METFLIFFSRAFVKNNLGIFLTNFFLGFIFFQKTLGGGPSEALCPKNYFLLKTPLSLFGGGVFFFSWGKKKGASAFHSEPKNYFQPKNLVFRELVNLLGPISGNGGFFFFFFPHFFKTAKTLNQRGTFLNFFWLKFKNFFFSKALANKKNKVYGFPFWGQKAQGVAPFSHQKKFGPPTQILFIFFV